MDQTAAAPSGAAPTRSTDAAMARILVATPLGGQGQGGIDRMMDNIRPHFADRRRGVDVIFAPTRGKGSILLSPLYTLSFIARMAGLKMFRGLDALHINLSSYGSVMRKYAVARSAALLGVPYAVHLHGSQFREAYREGSSRYRKRVEWIFKHAALSLVLGTNWRSFVIDEVGAPADRVEIFPNATAAMPEKAARPEGARTTILFLGRLGERKGIHILVEALSRLADRSDWRAVLGGDGEVKEVSARIEALGLQDRVEVPGWMGPDQTRDVLLSGDILVLPSFAENLPMSVIEGMSVGLAVIATDVGAVRDILADYETGFVIEPGDVDQLHARLVELLDDPALRQRLGEGARAFHGERLELGAYSDRLRDLWLKVAGR